MVLLRKEIPCGMLHPVSSTIQPNNDLFIKQLPTLLTNVIVLDRDFNIVVVSQDLLSLLDFESQELVGKNINYLTGQFDFVSVLKKHFVKDFFEKEVADFHGKRHGGLQMQFSGYRNKFLKDCKGEFLLKIKRLPNTANSAINDLSETSELDKFIYRTAHDLRGPLATMKGLINLIKIREDNLELERFISLLDAHANRLDERLFQLVYVAQSGNVRPSPNAVDFNGIETSLRQIIEKNAFVDFLEFHYSAPNQKINEIDDGQLSMLLSNMLLYLLALPMSSVHVQVFFRLTVEKHSLNITIASQGFETTVPLREAIHHTESLYTSIINFPQLLNFYAAQKIAAQLNAAVNVQFLGTDKQRIAIAIPYCRPI